MSRAEGGWVVNTNPSANQQAKIDTQKNRVRAEAAADRAELAAMDAADSAARAENAALPFWKRKH